MVITRRTLVTKKVQLLFSVGYGDMRARVDS